MVFILVDFLPFLMLIRKLALEPNHFRQLSPERRGAKQIYANYVMSSRMLTLYADEILEHANNALALIL